MKHGYAKFSALILIAELHKRTDVDNKCEFPILKSANVTKKVITFGLSGISIATHLNHIHKNKIYTSPIHQI